MFFDGRFNDLCGAQSEMSRYNQRMSKLKGRRKELGVAQPQATHASGATYQTYKETQRLVIRPWDDYDAEELFELAKEPEIGFWCGWEPHKHIEDTLFVLHNFLEVSETYAICLKDSGKVIGSIGLHFKGNTDLTDKDDECELGYWVGKAYWNNGYVTEAANEMIRHAFMDLDVSTIWCGYYDGNDRSKRVQEKLGFIYHHTSYNVEVRQLNTTRTGHVNYLTKEKWCKKA